MDKNLIELTPKGGCQSQNLYCQMRNKTRPVLIQKIVCDGPGWSLSSGGMLEKGYGKNSTGK